MKSPEVPVGRKPAGHAAMPRASYRAPRLGPLSLRNWPVSRRLFAVIVMAVVMGLVFGGLRVAAAANTAAGFGRTAQLAILGEHVTQLAQSLENERDITAAYDSGGGWDRIPATGGIPVVTAKDYTALGNQMASAQAATKTVAAQVRTLAQQIIAPFPAITQAKAAQVITQINNLPGLESESQAQPSLSAIENYNETISDLFALNDEITSGSGDPVLADEVRTLDAMSRAKDQASQQRAILYAALVNGSFTGGAQQSLLTSQGLQTEYLFTFQSSATTSELDSYENTVAGKPIFAAQLLNNYLGASNGSGGSSAAAGTNPCTGAKMPRGQDAGASALIMEACELGNQVYGVNAPQTYYGDMSQTITRMRSVEVGLASAIVARAQALQHGARQSAEFTAAVTGGVLLLVLIAALIVARSLVEPLRRLQSDALEVATIRLPERVAELSEATDPQSAMQIEPISVSSTDEIGKVARAFDQVHREAVRLAGNEALLRGNLNAMFISLSRRSVPLIERLARMIDSLEQNEDDPDRLSNLFSMDHLVTRMRRNSENLLVLAGEEPVRKWSEPVPLADVARAATSEIEQYSRVVLNIQPGIAVSGQAAADVVHLLAEIIENATMFSPRDTPVHVSGQEVASGGVLLEVRDSGVGVSPQRLSEMNWRLDNPPLIDVSVSRHMGLFAVSRLAARHGVRVRLRPVSPQGLSALVWLPGNLVGREAVKYGADRVQLAQQTPAAQMRMGGRRISGRHRQGLHPGEDSLSITGAQAPVPTGPVPTGPVSNWFRAKRPSSAGGQESAMHIVAQEPMGRGPAMETSWSDGGWRVPGGPVGPGGLGGNGAGGDPSGSPVQGERTSAGLPTRIPRANLFPGSVGGRSNGHSTGEMPAYRQQPARYDSPPPPPGYDSPTPGYDSPAANYDSYESYDPAETNYETESPTYPLPSRPRRSAEMARNRLSGFQLGSREAQGRGAGEEASR